MTTAEIIAHVMALPNIDICRLTATEIIGCHIENEPNGIKWYRNRVDDFEIRVDRWHPDRFRDQSRMVTDETLGWFLIIEELGDAGPLWWDLSPLQECQYALIAHYTRRGGSE